MNKFISEKTFSVLQFSIAFFFGKGMQFIAPLILANILTLQQYGKIEFAMSVSLSIVSIASFGAFTFIPRSIVQKEKWISKNLIYAYLLVISFIFILLSLILNNSEPSKLFKIIFIFSGILLLQGGLSATLKSQQRRSLAMVLDSMLWIAILISSLGIAAQIFSINGSSLYMVCMTYFTILVIFIWKNIDQAHIFKGNLNIRYFKVGARIIIIGFSSVAIAVSGRFLAGLVFDLEQVGHYSALYRVSIIPIICHQFIILYLYRYAYLSKSVT